MEVCVWTGDITEAPAEAICTSTNPRLSLLMGSGGAVRERGGFEVLRECEEIVEGWFRVHGSRELPLGSVHVTTAGALPYKRVMHCVASDHRHASSAEVIRVCVQRSLARAMEEGCRTVAMPVFASGHAHYRFDRAIEAIAGALAAAPPEIDRVVVVVLDPERAGEALALLRGMFPDARGC